MDPKDNNCLCVQRDSSYAWFVPTDECGECPGNSKPVNTDYMDVYDIIADCKARTAD